MKHKLFTLLIAVIVGEGTMFASDIKINGIWYNIDSSTQTAEVTFQGPNYYTAKEYTGNVVIPETITYNNVSYSVTSIGADAFHDCGDLISVVLPKTITAINSDAFSWCRQLETISFPENLISIGKYAFNFCSNLTDITIPNSVTYIGEYAFGSCGKITSPLYNLHVFAFLPKSFSGEYIVPVGVNCISGGAFAYCNHLTKVTICSSVTSIETGAFYGCSSLNTIVCDATIPPKASALTFTGITLPIQVSVPLGSEELYKAADGWKLLFRDPIVTFKNWDGTILKQDTVRIGGTATPPADPVREGYVFAGWKESYSNIKDDAIVTAYFVKKIPTDMTTDEIGAINGVFSVAEGRQVVFSKGNLQYNAAQGSHACADGSTQPGTWRFAENQMEIRAYENSNRSETYDGWIDLFHYGASGYNGMIPNRNTPADAAMYQQVGALQGSYYDFGLYNAISNGGNQPGIWRLFTQNEWYYIVRDRANALRLRAHATINGVEGLILLPDNCDTIALRNKVSFNPNDYVMNNYSLSAWNSIEAFGAVFLPVSGAMSYQFTYLVWDGNYTHYMCAYSVPLTSISCASFSTNTVGTSSSSATAISVRLVQDVDVFHLNAVSNNSAWGMVSGDSLYWNEAISATATPNTGYHFVQWSDGNTDNPRTFTLTGDSTISAEFAPDIHTMDVTCDTEQGNIVGESGEYGYMTEQIIEAVANYGYTFSQWSDGVTDNPRTVVITQDTTITAIFTINHYPVVLLDHDGKLLSKQSVAYNRAAEVPEIPVREGYTFAGWTTDIEHITDTTYAIAVYNKIGGTVIYKAEDGEIIGSENVDLHLPAAPMISGKTFAGWLTESVDSESGIVLRATYTTDNPTTHDDVSVVPGSTTAAVNFPYITGALTYELVIRDLFGRVVCKILFNSTGHLLGIALAPGRDRSAAPAQTDGFNFTVEGLDPNTTYNYEFVAHDDTDEVIETLSGSFTTTDENSTGVENVQRDEVQCTKELRNDHVYILRGDKVYTITGQEAK